MASERRKLHYGIEFQRSVLKLMLDDYVFCSKVVEFAKSNDFAQPLDWFYSKIRELYETLQKCPTRADLSVEIATQGESEMVSYQMELDKIMASQVDVRTILSEMTGWARLNLFVETSYETVEKVKKFQFDEAYLILAEKSFKIGTFSFEKDKFVSFGDGVDVINKMAAQREGAIQTGIRAIDEALGGGMFPGTWTTWLGASNAGKSMVNVMLAFFAAKQGKKTFITIHEDEELPTKMRYLAGFSNIEYNRLLFGFDKLTEEEVVRFNNADHILKEFVKMQFMYSNDATIEAVCDAARSVMKQWPYDLFICDYGGCLSSKRFKDLSNARLVQEHVHFELKQLCLTLNVPGTGGAQVNREAMNKNKAGADLLRMTDVAEAIGIIKKASTVITMNRSAKDIENDRIIFLLDKSRGGITNMAVDCITDFSKCRTHLPKEDHRVNQTTLDMKAGLAGRHGDEGTTDKDTTKKVSHG